MTARTVDAVLGSAGVSVAAEDVLLEVGCGVGRLTRVLAARASAVIALDVSAEMLRRARELNPGLANGDSVQGDGTSLAGVRGASVDGCFSHVVFQHVPDPSITLGYVAEMGRVLRPGGWAAFQVSDDPSVHRPAAGLRGLALRVNALLGRSPRGQTDPAWVGSAVDQGELRSVAAGAGLDVTRVAGAGTQFCVVALRRAA